MSQHNPTTGTREAVGAAGVRLIHGDALEAMPTLPSASIDAIIADPPYPEIQRPYGRLTEAEWHELMRGVVAESRRVLKPTGSAVFVLQPNSERVGRMRAWLWEFMAWTAREWNQVQDCWWWNTATLPQACTIHGKLCRPSLKACVWLGPTDCYRNQNAVLWEESDANKATRLSARAVREHKPSGHSVNPAVCTAKAMERGGTTPFNVIPIANTDSQSSSGAEGHGAGTPHDLADWWVRYISPPNGVVLDPFAGVGTIPLAALMRGRSVVAIERDPGYFATMTRRIERPHLVVPRPRREEPEPRDWLFSGSEVAG